MRSGPGRYSFHISAERIASPEGSEKGRVHFLPESLREGPAIRLLQSRSKEDRVSVQECARVHIHITHARVTSSMGSDCEIVPSVLPSTPLAIFPSLIHPDPILHTA